MTLRFPVNFIGITQKFKPATKIFKGHKGIDLGWNNKYGGKNAPIYAAADGVVCATKDYDKSHKSWGNYVKINHGNNTYTLYAHLKDGLKVKNNQEVKQGDLIGYMGNTGHVIDNGYHLHFEVYKGGSATKYRVNPLLYTYVYPDQVVAESTKKEFPNLLYYNEYFKKYIKITAKSGLWCRKGVGFKYPKYKAIPYGTKCELLEKNCGYANGYNWWKIIYDGDEVYIPYMADWVKEL